MDLKKIWYGALVALMISCEVPDNGFFSYGGIKMQEDTLDVIRGLYQISATPFLDGSSTPIQFEIKKVRDLKTGKVIEIPAYELNLWMAPFDPKLDTTIDLVNRKLIKRKTLPFEVAYSGQMVFNGATQYLEGDAYSVDVMATNSAGSELLENYCRFKLFSKPFEVIANNFTDVFVGGTNELTGSPTPPYTNADGAKLLANTHKYRKLTKIANADILQVILVVRDAAGKPFKGDDILFWPEGNGYLKSYHDKSIAARAGMQKVEKTDTSCVFHFPTVPWPAFQGAASQPETYAAAYTIRWAACKMSDEGKQLADQYPAYSSYSPRFKSGYKINETGVWLMEVKVPYVLRK